MIGILVKGQVIADSLTFAGLAGLAFQNVCVVSAPVGLRGLWSTYIHGIATSQRSDLGVPQWRP